VTHLLVQLIFDWVVTTLIRSFMLADISITSTAWVDTFLLLAVIVAIIALVLNLLKVPFVPEVNWIFVFAILGLGFAGLLFQ